MRPDKNKPKPQRPSPEGLHAQKIREAADALDEAFIAGDPPNSPEINAALEESHAAWEAGMASLGQERPKPIEKLREFGKALAVGYTPDEFFIPDDEHGRSRLSDKPRRPLRCRLGWHRWNYRMIVEPMPVRCALCGKEKP